MKQRVLVSAITMGLLASLSASAVYAQDSDKDESQKLDVVTVTGSLIPQAQIEQASPLITITSEEIEKQGFGNISDALRAQPLATGSVQDSQFSQGFTPGASTISLLGLAPGFTLILINGHPMADYPLLFNGASNFVDLSSIPTAMVDRIDILPGNQSSIYGSSAIAGVINIILKQKIDGVELNVRNGGFAEGGGQNQRLQITGGQSWGDLDLTYALQINNQEPIWAFQRDFADSTNDNPSATSQFGSRTFLYFAYPTTYYDPGTACDALGGLFGGTTQRDNRPGRGYYCGSREQVGYQTLLNENRSGSAYIHMTDRFSENMELYGDILYNVSSVSFNSGSRFWLSSIDTGGYFVNQATGQFESFQHIFAPEETGALDANTERNLARSYNINFGSRGNIGSSDWGYDAYYARSQYTIGNSQLWPLKDKVESFFQQQFLGPVLGDYYGYPIYQPNVANFYKALTPAEYASFQGAIYSESETWTQNVNLQVNNMDLFELPAGSVGFAGLVQAGNQSWDNPTDPRVVNGEFWGLTGTQGAGKRDNWATAGELRVPLFSMLTAGLSARYDDYTNNGGGGDAKSTYKLGLEFRPLESLLFRGNYATAFRAPDMSYTFAGNSGFYTQVTDYYRCATEDPDSAIEDCAYNPVQTAGNRSGNRDLTSITAKSFGYGVVWSPMSNFNVKADYYDIKIDNEVNDIQLDQLLRTESACRLGELDINSATCVDALARITRSSASSPNPNVITLVSTGPINISNEHVAGIVASTTYKMDAGRFGAFKFGADYNVTMKHELQQYPTDPTLDLLRDPFYSSEFKSIFSGNVTWDIGKWSTTLYGIRYGSTPNYRAQINSSGYAASGAGKIAPYMVYNGSVTYKVADNTSVAFAVNNILNNEPPEDSTWTAWPYYNNFNYNGYGRAYWVEFDMKFGGGSK